MHIERYEDSFTLRCVEKSEIPGKMKVVIPVFIQRAQEEDVCSDLLFEPSEDLMQKTSLLIAPSLVNVRGKTSSPCAFSIRLMRPR